MSIKGDWKDLKEANYHFWNPNSGLFGGMIAGALGGLSLLLLILYLI